MFCCRQVQAVQQEIDNVKAEIQATKQRLAAAEQADDGAKVESIGSLTFCATVCWLCARRRISFCEPKHQVQHCLPC